MLQQMFGVWSSLSFTRRIAAIAGVAITILAMVALARLATTPGMALLYGNLEPSQAGEVITALDRQNARYQVRGSTIYVEEGRRDELRMMLASEGLPANSAVGYELLDNLTGFGTTSQMFDAAYWRAKEGELARTIVASAFARNARVHIANATSGPFQRGETVSASVFVTPAGFDLSDENAKALKFLISSAVSGLAPDNVAIIDATTGRIIDDSSLSDPSQTASDQATRLQIDAEQLLEAHVGHGNAKVKVNLETITDTESIIERRFDPEGRVAISTDSQEVSRSTSGPAGGGVTVASNVPSGDAAGGAGESSSQDNEIRERTNFEVSETQREILKTPGAISRLTVAVLVNGISEVDNAGVEIWRARTEQELNDLRELVQSAVGFREDRGDQITIKSLQFNAISPEGSGAPGNNFNLMRLDPMTLIQLGVLAIVVLLLGFFVVRPIFLTRNATAIASTGSGNEAGEDGLAYPRLETSETEGMDYAADSDSGLPELAPLGDFQAPMTVVDDFDFDGSMDEGDENPVDRLKQVIESRQPDTVEILRNWLETPERTEEPA